jgi:mannose-1-phosphate guanylyltransferase
VAKPPGRLANAAVYIVEPEIHRLLGGLGREVIDLSTQVIPSLLGRIFTYRIRGYHRDIGSPAALEAARAAADGGALDGRGR